MNRRSVVLTISCLFLGLGLLATLLAGLLRYQPRWYKQAAPSPGPERRQHAEDFLSVMSDLWNGIQSERGRIDEAVTGFHFGDSARGERFGEPFGEGFDVGFGKRGGVGGGLGRVGIDADAGEDVREVHAGRADGDADFSRARNRIGRITNLQHLRRAVARHNNLSHR